MNKSFLNLVLLLAAGLTATLVSAGIGGVIPVAEQQAPRPKLKFDGIWVGPGNVTLIKELQGYVLLQGKDEFSTWTAKGVINGNQLTCRGSGVTNDGKHFAFESTIVWDNGELIDTWKALFADGQFLEGKDRLRQVNVGQP